MANKASAGVRREGTVTIITVVNETLEKAADTLTNKKILMGYQMDGTLLSVIETYSSLSVHTMLYPHICPSSTWLTSNR